MRTNHMNHARSASQSKNRCWKAIRLTIAASIVSSCSTLTWEAPSIGDRLVEDINREFPTSGEEFATLKARYCEQQTSDEERARIRDRIVHRLVVRIQEYHEAVETDLFKTTAAWGTMFDVLTLSLTTSAALATGSDVKSLLAGLGAISAGSRIALEQNVLREKSREAILAAMKSQRAEALAVVYRGLEKEDAAYPLERALSDVVAYFNAGSVASALSKLVEEANFAKRRAEVNLSRARSAEDEEGNPLQGARSRKWLEEPPPSDVIPPTEPGRP